MRNRPRGAENIAFRSGVQLGFREESYAAVSALQLNRRGMQHLEFPKYFLQYFCQHNSGHDGASYWNSLQLVLTAVEKELAIFCALAADAPIQTIAFVQKLHKTAASLRLGDELNPKRVSIIHGRLWDGVAIEHAKCFAHCYNACQSLTWSDIRSICGADVGLLEKSAAELCEAMLSKHSNSGGMREVNEFARGQPYERSTLD